MKKISLRIFKLFLLILLFFSLWVAGRFFQIDPSGIKKILENFPFFWSLPVFIFLYVIITFFLWFSKDIFKLTGALFFGPYLSALLIFIAEVLNAFILFFIARFLGRPFVEKKLKANFGNLDKKISGLNFLWLLLFRITPLIPFRVLDIASGLTSISFRRYLAAVLAGSPLRIFWVQYVYAGLGASLLTKPQLLLNYLAENKALFILTFVYIILVIFVAVKIRKGS